MYFIAAVIFIYLLMLLVVIIYWRKPDKKYDVIEKKVHISVVIPVRNEPQLNLLLKDLNRQTLHKQYYEVIIVDDHSVQPVQKSYNEKVIGAPKNKNGKKAALEAGIQNSTGNVITTIDADCRIGNNFLITIYELFSKNDVVLSPGLVNYAPAVNLFEKLQALENLALMGTGVALHRLGTTSLSNGANLAFQKKIWQELDGYKSHAHIASGDDEFFVQEVANRYPDKIKFRTGPETIVETVPNKKLSRFFHQRLRWASKWRHYKNGKARATAVVVFLFHLIICAGLVFLFDKFPPVLILLFIIKLILEGYLICSVAKKIRADFYPLPHLFLQFLYSPYVVFFGLASNFLSYKWKDRRYNH